MAVVLRLKRKLEDDPANGLIVYQKKARNHENVHENSTRLFRFVGTVKNKKDDLGFLRTAIKEGKVENLQWGNDPKLRQPKILPKLRDESRKKSRESRLQIINAHRPLEHELPSEEETEVVRGLYKLYDVIETESSKDEQQSREKDQAKPSDAISLNGVPLVRRPVGRHADDDFQDEDCVYDIYYAQDFGNMLLEKDFSVERCALGDELVNMDYRDDEEGYEDDEDDSNDEDNWRNDYPDEDPEFFENEYDFFRDYEDEEEREMMERIQGRGFGFEDATTDSDSEDPDDVQSFQLLHHCRQDVEMHGPKYAKYKAKVLEEFEDQEDRDDYDDDDT